MNRLLLLQFAAILFTCETLKLVLQFCLNPAWTIREPFDSGLFFSQQGLGEKDDE